MSKAAARAGDAGMLLDCTEGRASPQGAQGPQRKSTSPPCLRTNRGDKDGQPSDVRKEGLPIRGSDAEFFSRLRVVTVDEGVGCGALFPFQLEFEDFQRGVFRAACKQA